MLRPHYIAGFVVDPTFEEPQYLLLRRASSVHLPGIWQMVTGKLNDNEPVHQAVVREIFEETALHPHRLFNVDVTSFYDQHKSSVAFSANFCAFVSSKKEVIISALEHDTYQWCSYSEAFDLLAFPSQKETLNLIHHYFVLQEPHPYNQIL